MTPKISVLLPTYNTKAVYLKAAIESILNQTYTNFELIVLDDGSKEYVGKLVKNFTDKRIRYIHKENTGIADTLNQGLVLAQGEYIARMDADDLAVCTRFKKQIKYLEENPEVSVVGSWVMKFQECGGIIRFPLRLTYKDFIHCCAINHPSMMWRKKDFEKYNLKYDPDYSCEDYELWSRAIRVLKFINMPEVLLYYRINDESITYTRQMALEKDAARVRSNLINWAVENHLEVPKDKTEFSLEYKKRYNFHFLGKHLKLTKLNRKIAVVNLKGKAGSLGDQMFQYAFGYALHQKYNLDVRFDDTFYATQFTGITEESFPYQLYNFPNLEIKFSGGDCTNRIKRDYVFKLKNAFFKHVKNKGYYKDVIGNDTSFKEYSTDLAKIFKFGPITNACSLKIYDQIKATPNSVFVDCEDFENNPTYYKCTINDLRSQVAKPTFFIFNDTEHKLDYKKNHDFVSVDEDTCPNECIKLQLMSSCKYSVQSKSSLSWWANWLINNKEKTNVI